MFHRFLIIYLTQDQTKGGQCVSGGHEGGESGDQECEGQHHLCLLVAGAAVQEGGGCDRLLLSTLQWVTVRRI